MSRSSSKTINMIERSLWKYGAVTPTYHKIKNIMSNNGCNYRGSIDHIAWRSLSFNGGINNIEKILLSEGLYKRRDRYEFPEQKLSAQWFSPEDSELPRIFVSQVNEEKLLIRTREIIESYTWNNTKKFDGVSSGKDSWGPIIISDYLEVAKDSDYAAWVLVFGCMLHHLAIPVHLLDKYNCIQDFITLLINNKIIMLKDGQIQVSKDKLLSQGITISDLMEGPQHGSDMIEVPGTSVEVISRKEGREGFDEGNVRVIVKSSDLEYRSKHSSKHT